MLIVLIAKSCVGSFTGIPNKTFSFLRLEKLTNLENRKHVKYVMMSADHTGHFQQSPPAMDCNQVLNTNDKIILLILVPLN